MDFQPTNKMFQRFWLYLTLAALTATVLANLAPQGITKAAAATNPTPAGTPSGLIEGPGCTQTSGWYGSGTSYSLSGGDYSGSDHLSGSCNNTTWWTWTNSSPTVTYEWDDDNTIAYKSCTIYAYIPTTHAGAPNVRYDIWGADSQYNLHWIGWPGYTWNQQNLPGWYKLYGPVSLGNFWGLSVTMTNQATPGWEIGAGDIGFTCS